MQDKYEKIAPVEKLIDTTNIEGYVESKFNKELIQQHELMRQYTDKACALVTQLMTSYDELKENLLSACKNLENISLIHKKLRNLSYMFSDLNSITMNFESMSTISLEWSKIKKNQIQLFDTEFKEFFSFYADDLNHFKEQSEIYNKYKNTYIKSYIYLKNKKEKLYRNCPIEKWEINANTLSTLAPDFYKNKEKSFEVMCSIETLGLIEKRRKLGVLCNGNINDFILLKRHHAKRFKKGLLSMCDKNEELLTIMGGMKNMIKDSSDFLMSLDSSDAYNSVISLRPLDDKK